MIVVAGEALIDLAPTGGALVPLRGGSPYNVAVGLARQGAATSYLGRLSTDAFGRLLADGLLAEGVDLGLVTRTADPTTLAIVHLDAEGRAEYAFYLVGTSAARLVGEAPAGPGPGGDEPAGSGHGGEEPAGSQGDEAALPMLPEAAALHLSLGAVTLRTEPAGSTLRRLLQRERGRRTICLDPNVRPAAVGDLAGYRPLLEEAVADCDIVKASDEDLRLLEPGRDPVEVAERWAGLGPRLVVVTLGADGAVALSPHGRVEVPGQPVDVVDTVGAGDAFTAGLLAWLDHADRLRPGRLAGLGERDLEAALQRAVEISARTCARRGADPPRADGA